MKRKVLEKLFVPQMCFEISKSDTTVTPSYTRQGTLTPL